MGLDGFGKEEPGAAELYFDSAEGEVELLGYLVVGEVVEIAQFDDGAVAGLETVDEVAHDFVALAVDEVFLGVVVAGGDGVFAGVVFLVDGHGVE